MENDVLNRKETQDWAVNIVVGIGGYKRVLSEGGIEKLKNIFDKMANSKKVVFLLVDDYESMRILKLEEWYNKINNKSGIWIGPDVNDQSMIEAEDITAEEAKLSFEGMAYEIDESKCKLIKTILEGED